MHVILDHIEQITPTIRTFWFRPEQRMRYVAGQFTELYLPHEGMDDRGIRRWFTLSSSPTEELLGVTTRIENNGSTFKKQLAGLIPGTKLHLADPMGDFVLPKDSSIPLIFVAAGLGITPVRSMIKWLHDSGEQRQVKLLFVTSPNEIAFEDLFASYKLDFQPITENTRQQLTAETIHTIAGNGSLIYISGPEELVETLYKELKRLGIDPSRLVADYFPGYVNL